MANPELVEEYERQAKPGGATRRGYLPPDHPVFTRGQTITGRNKPGTTAVGYLPPDDPIYRGGPIVAGRRILSRDN